MTTIAGYTITETLSEEGNIGLYRGQRDQASCLIKAPRSKHPSTLTLERLTHEGQLADRLDSAWALRPLGLEPSPDGMALVFEDFAAQTLDHFIGFPMETGRFLAIAISLSTALDTLHRQGLTHKDIKPSNILLKADTGEVKLTGFGIASLLSHEHAALPSPDPIEGTLAYLSPEQTGRMNRTLDYRTDFYSLGVCFYQMLTAALPCEGADPREWVYCQIARQPIPPVERVEGIPRALSNIVMKLLRKDAEDRYQTAAGLRADLRRCQEQWTSTGRITPFPLGEHDLSDRFQIPQKLYGREREFKTLLNAFERVADGGTPELVLVSGYSGIGKTALVRHLQAALHQRRGMFGAGRFEQYQRDIPYHTVVQAFHGLVNQILALGEEQIADWRQRLAAALGPNARLIIDVIPAVEWVIGEQPPVPELPPAEAQNRFRMVFRKFIEVFARPQHPLTLFLDDLQWADSGSLGLLKDLVTRPELRQLLVVGAYRDNEVNPAHPLILTLDRARDEGATLVDLVLGPLSKADVACLVADTLHRERDEVAALAALIHAKTAGNPFFAIQFFTALSEEGLLRFDPDLGVWQWDMAKIEAKGFTDNVVDLMLGRLKRLPSATQETIELAACLGSWVEASFLALVCGESEDALDAKMIEAVRAGLLFRLKGAYYFLHDRVQEAAYSMIPEAQRPSEHLMIGRLLLSGLQPAQIEARIFDVVGQLNRGATLVTDPAEKASLVRLNVLAGMKAKSAIAYASARHYLLSAATLLPEDAWKQNYPETFSLFLGLAECEYLDGAAQLADERIDAILARARTNLDRARIYQLRMRLYQVSGRFGDGMRVSREALSIFGIRLPDSPGAIAEAIEAENGEIRRNLRGRSISELEDAPAVGDAKVRAMIALLAESATNAYNAEPPMLPVLILAIVNLSLRYGNTEDSGLAYCYYAVLLVMAGEVESAFAYSEMAQRLNDRFQNVRRKGMILYIRAALINAWGRHMSTNRPLMEQALEASLNAGDLVYAGFNANDSIWQAWETGEPLADIHERSHRNEAFARQTHNDIQHELIRLQRQFIASQQGGTLEPTSFDDDAFSEERSLATFTRVGFQCGVGFFHTMKQVVYFMQGRYLEALDAANRAEGVSYAIKGLTIEATHVFYHALTLAALYPRVSPEQQAELARQLDSKLRVLALWAKNCPENYLNRHALVAAEVARIRGDALPAERLYEQAIQSARANGFVQNEGVAYELAARDCLTRGLATMAGAYLREARYCYARWGADAKVRQLEQGYPQFLGPGPINGLRPIGTEHLDAMAVLKASQAISREIVLPKLLETLMQTMIEHAGAERGTLILVHRDDLTIAAHVGTAPTAWPSVADLPEPILTYVKRSHQSLILDDAAGRSMFSSDPYVLRHRPKSVLCMPLLRQAELLALIYLENNLVASAFTPSRIAVLEVLASQAVISLENARLVSGLQRASIVVEHSPTVLFRAKPEPGWPIEYVSENVERVLGYTAEELSSGPVSYLSLIHPDDRASVLNREQQFIASGNDAIQLEYRIVRKDGQVRWVEIVSAVERDPEGRLSIYQGTLVDITERKEAENERARLLVREQATQAELAAAKELDRLKDQFVNAVSHDLRTPLTSIRGYAEFLEDELGGPLSPQQGEFVQQIERGAKRLERLVNDLLDFARLEAGTFHLNLEDADLGQKVHDIIQSLRPQAEGARLRLEAVLPETPLVAPMDPQRVEQVLSNLIGNALKFTPEGGRIEVRARVEGDRLLCEVEDTGEGIAPADIPKLFQRFGQLESGIKKKGGTGLGLSISKAIIEAHGGRIGVRSQKGTGSTFWFTLPLPHP
jgi:PAS domain S-box-containing protein